MLGELIRGLKTLRNAGGDLKLSGVTRGVARVLKTTRLSDFLKKADEAAAEHGATIQSS